MQMIPVRLFYYKKNRLKYISHLDTMEVFNKALSRSKLPVWYTQGFNPHIYKTILMPLSLGYEGLREPLDFRLVSPVEPKVMITTINRHLPIDMQIIYAGEPAQDAGEIATADYEIMLELENPQQALDQFAQFYGCNEIIVEKKTKKKAFYLDIKPDVTNVLCKAEGDYLVVYARVATGNNLNINPRLLVDAFADYIGEEIGGVYVTRKNFYTADGREFY